MPIGTDFEQFCAAREFIFFGPIKCCSRICMDKKCCLGTRKIQNAALEKVLLPDDENDPTGRGIRFSKKAGI